MPQNALPSVDSLRAMGAPFLAEYFGVWAVKEDFFRAAVGRVSTMDLAAHVRTQRDSGPRAGVVGAGGGRNSLYRVTMCEDGVAVVEICGTLMKQETSLDESTSTVALRRTMRALAEDDNVLGVMLCIESPGGSSAGTQELADDIAALAAVKPVHAYILDLGASAAYWLASQAHSISTNPQGWVGSIGTYATVCDYSGAAAKDGIKVHVVRAGEFKGAGTPGTEVTDGHLAEWQRLVDQTNAFFLRAVEKGRGLSAEEVKQLNDGRVYIGADAKAKRLVDQVETFDQAMGRLRSAIGGQQNNKGPESSGNVAGGGGRHPAQATADAEPRKDSPMSQSNTAPAATSEPKPASMLELKGACPGAPSDFLVAQAEANATVAQAKDAFLQFQSAQIRARDEQIRKLQAKTKVKAEDTVPPPADDEDEEEKPTPPAEKSKKAKAEDEPPADDEEKEPAAPAAKRGVRPISSRAAEVAAKGGGGEDGAVGEFEDAVKSKMDRNPKLTRQDAAAKVLAEDDDLRNRYCAARNAQRVESKR